MAKPNRLVVICFLISFTLCFASCFGYEWCIQKPGALTAEQQQRIINLVCTHWDCSPLKPGGQCFDPNRIEVHASYAMNLNFRKTNFCDLDVSYLTAADPSYGNCHYP